MTDIRDLILDNEDEDNNEKTANDDTGLSDATEHEKIAEQLEALSEDDTILEDLLKSAIMQDWAESLQEGESDEK